VLKLLERDARDKTFFADHGASSARRGADDADAATVQRGRRAPGLRAAIEDRTGGYPRHHRVDQDFVTTGEFRTLAASYQDVKDIRGPMMVRRRTTRSRRAEREDVGGRDERDRHRRRADRRGDAAGRRAEAARRLGDAEGARTKDGTCRSRSLDELVEFFTAAGKKGVAVNRYKGLGEMNPDTLWETTMNPERRARCCRCAPRTTWRPT
jgi:DNA gyrase/topoisomerase IV subunit B